MKGTTGGFAAEAVSMSKSGIRHGQSNKNTHATGKRKPKPTGPTSPIKGSDRGGV